MKIAIETTWVQGQPTGIGYYILGLLQGLKEVAPENEYYLLHSSKEWNGPDFGEQFTPVSYYFGKAALALQFRLGRVLKGLKVDVYHATAGSGVPPHPPCPTVCSVLDLVRFQDIRYGSGWNGWLFKQQFKQSIRFSNAFICISQCTVDDLYFYFPEVKNMTTVVTHLATDLISPIPNATRKHLLCVGGIESRKRSLFLVDVYRELLQIMPDAPPLVFAGPDRGDGMELVKKINDFGLCDKVLWLGYIDQEKKRQLYSEAILFLMPSQAEGFGIPLLEAMHCNVPVVASDIPIFHEIGGDACELIRDWNPVDWAQSLRSLLSDSDRCAGLISKGKINAAKYTWELCAEKTMACYHNLELKND